MSTNQPTSTSSISQGGTITTASLQGVANTPYGPIQFETLARLIERVGVLILLGGVLHYVLNGQSALIAAKLESIDRRLEAMNIRFDQYLDTQDRNRQP